MKRITLLAVALLTVTLQTMARGGFALVIDPESYEQARTEVTAYAAAIESVDGLKVYTVVDRWGVPDSIRAALMRLHADRKTGLEGVVLVGDIPIAMIRDAQHLTSAFKMKQSMDRKRSSVPSDRYYDDFGLDFTYQGRDDDAPYFYYSLTAKSEQRLEPDLYSGRIRPTDAGGTSRYEKLRAYLRKVVAEKQARPQLRRMFFFSGHGYISESKVARMDEKSGWYMHFPWLKGREDAISYMDHSDTNPVKEHLMNELMRPDLDFAILHHHGYWNTQYLNNIPVPRNPKQAKEYIQAYSRAHVRAARERGRNADSIRLLLEERLDLPATWLDNTFDTAMVRRDSLADAVLDLHLEDFKEYGYTPNCRVVMIDACFCGSFHLDNCIASEYLFSPGRTVACIANSVNVLQDKWSDRLAGLIGMGGCVGDVVRYSTYLESHVLGDPTFRFRLSGKGCDVDELIRTDNVGAWKKLLAAEQPDLQVLAIEHLYRHKAIGSKQLLDIFKNSPHGLVRMQALQTLAQGNDDCFIEALQLGVNDSYELVQRHALRLIGTSGDERLIPALVSVAIRNNTSERCNFNAMNALSFYPKEELLAEFRRQFDSPAVAYVNKERVRGMIERTITRCADKWTADMEAITHPETTEKKRLAAIRTLRNYCVFSAIPALTDYVETCGNEQVQVDLLEALGWHRNAYNVALIRETAQRMSNRTDLPEAVRNEALKTYRRVQ